MILCFDIGGTAIKVAEAHAPDDIRPRGRIATPAQDRAAFVAALAGAIHEPPDRIAISIAGAVDPETGVATVANIPCLSGTRLQAELEGALGLPVDLANDADCFALAEAGLGAGRGHRVVLGLILGTGVGGGLVVDGRLIEGAGELGHGPVAGRIVGDVTLPAMACGCGQIGCLDAVCSARGMEKIHAALHGTTLDSRDIVAGWQAGDPAATRTIEVWRDVLAGPLAMVQNLLGAGVIVAGGGLASSAPLMAALDTAVQTRVLRPLGRPLIVPARGGIEPGLVGAALLGLSRAG